MSRPREDGIVIGTLEPGPRNSVADAGITVGHVTVERTGVTAVVPPSLPIPAGTAVLNGAGELTGSLEIREWGILETPVYLTSTHAVGRVYDGAVSVAMARDPRVGVDDVVIPVVGECDDSWLWDARVAHVKPSDVGRGVVATDAPLTPPQLERLARRAGLGLARAGSVAHHGSGEIFVAFAASDGRSFPDRELDPLFQAAVDATEEAVLCSLWAAVDTTGR